MTTYAVKENDEGAFRLIERMPSGKWRAIAVDLDEEELGDEIFSLIEDEELDPGDIVPVIGPGGRSDRRAIHFCAPDQKRSLGWALDDRPALGRPLDEYDQQDL